MSSDEGYGAFQIGSLIETAKQLWTLAMWVRAAYLRIRRVLPFLTISFIQRMLMVRWLLKRYVLPRYDGTYSGTVLALAPKIEAGAKFVMGGNAWSAVLEEAHRWRLTLEELLSPKSKLGARLETVLAVVAALVARELLGVFVRAVMEPEKKVA